MEIEISPVMSKSHLFTDAESRLMTERSLHQSEHIGLIKVNPQFQHREAGRDRGLMMSVLLVRTIGGLEALDKTQSNQINLNSPFPTDLREESKHSHIV